MGSNTAISFVLLRKCPIPKGKIPTLYGFSLSSQFSPLLLEFSRHCWNFLKEEKTPPLAQRGWGLPQSGYPLGQIRTFSEDLTACRLLWWCFFQMQQIISLQMQLIKTSSLLWWCFFQMQQTKAILFFQMQQTKAILFFQIQQTNATLFFQMQQIISPQMQQINTSFQM